MAAPSTANEVVTLLKKSRLLNEQQLAPFSEGPSTLLTPQEVMKLLQSQGLLTRFQAEQILKGRHKGFILGKYTLLERIGMGGMGQVYKAEHTQMRRRVALKVLPPDRGKSEFARERFLREARAAAAIEHPNIVRAFDVEMDGDVAFLVMEYIDGVNLHELVARRGKLAPTRAAYYLWQVCNGLSAVHERALVHRDIKPANLLLDRHGVVRILDLGLVRSQLDDDALTRGEGAKVVGTADYLAPEQAINCSDVDGRVDLYSLGCTAYYLLTGEPPFTSEKVSQRLLMHQCKEPKLVNTIRPEVPVGFAEVIHKLLAKKPEDRYQTALDVMQALEPWAIQPTDIPSVEDFPPNEDPANSPQSQIHGSRITLGSNTGMIMGRKTLIGGSAIRFNTDPAASSMNGLVQANQPTAGSAMQDTLPADSKPAAPKPIIVEQPTPKSAIRVEQPVKSGSTEDMEKAKRDSTSEKVAALFGVTTASTEPRPSVDRGNSGVAIWTSVAVLIIIAISIVAAILLR